MMQGLGRKRVRREDTGEDMSIPYNSVPATDTITQSGSYDIKSWGLAGSKALSATETEEIKLLVIAQQAGTGA